MARLWNFSEGPEGGLSRRKTFFLDRFDALETCSLTMLLLLC